MASLAMLKYLFLSFGVVRNSHFIRLSFINPYFMFFEGRWHSMHLAGDMGSGEAPVWRRTLLIYPAKLSSGGPLTFSLTGTGIIGCNLHKEFKQTLAP